MELTGTLHTFPLAELLEMMQQSSMCGVLELQGRIGLAQVWVRDGVICEAQYGAHQGRSALSALWEEPGLAFMVRSIDSHPYGPPGLGDAQALIRQAQETVQLWRPVSQRLPSLEVVPVVRPGAVDRTRLGELDWNVLMAIDGQHSIRALTGPTVLELLDVCRAVVRLLDGGLIDVPGSQPQVGPERPSAPVSTGEPAAQGGLLKRIQRSQFSL